MRYIEWKTGSWTMKYALCRRIEYQHSAYNMQHIAKFKHPYRIFLTTTYITHHTVWTIPFQMKG